MLLPVFRNDDWLPGGHHAATWEEIEATLGGAPGSRRASVLSDLLRWRDAVRAKGLSGLVILDGSFISTKAEPGDFDVIFVYREAEPGFIARDADVLALLDNAYCKANYGGDVWAFSEQAVRTFPQFCRIDGFDRDKITRQLKGVLEVEI